MEPAAFLAARETSICDHWMWELPLRVNVEGAPRSLADAAILDIGCGRGLVAEFFTSLGGRVTGIDIKRAARWRGTPAHGPKYVCSNSERLPFRDDAFDVVVSCSTFQHLEHSRVFAEIVRVTKDGGIVLLHENLPHNPGILLYRFIRRVRALFSPSLSAYTSTLHDYLSPDSSFPAAMRLENYRCYYFLSSACSALRLDKNPGYRLELAAMLFWIDSWLLERISWLRKLCWFCSYTLTIRKPAGR